MKGFILDLNRCTGCQACRLACSIENDLGAELSWRAVYTFNLHRHPRAPRFHLSLGCQHCAEPACLQGCPARAYSRDAATGAVLVDGDLCIGCSYCSWACPYDAPHALRGARPISKCTLCNHRLLEGKNPACAALCPTGALRYDEILPEHGLTDVPGFPATSLGPAIRFTPLRAAGNVPELSAAPGAAPESAEFRSLDAKAAAKVSLRSEWPLVLFTLGAALLVALAAAAFSGAAQVYADSFLLAGLGVIGVSALHLGPWQRGWRAVLNLRRSWLSREIVCYLAFLALTTAMLSSAAYFDVLGWPAVLAGFAALYCIDRVYETVSGSIRSRLHSARALLTGLFLFGILTFHPIVAGMTGLGKLVLYAHRQPWTGSKGRLLASLFRLGAGFVVPLAVWRVYPGWVLWAVLAGELIDRCEYYLDLDIQTPQRQIAADLRKTTPHLRPPSSDSQHSQVR
jgi:Fe-S-cluster-containing dehydrogenase component